MSEKRGKDRFSHRILACRPRPSSRLVCARGAYAFAGIDRHLTYEPFVETRNRKRMRPNPVAPWELRIGGLRVYFDIEMEPELVVAVLAIGRKIRDRVVIGRTEIEL